jgi:hypothetical protein
MLSKIVEGIAYCYKLLSLLNIDDEEELDYNSY